MHIRSYIHSFYMHNYVVLNDVDGAIRSLFHQGQFLTNSYHMYVNYYSYSYVCINFRLHIAIMHWFSYMYFTHVLTVNKYWV